MLKVDDRIYAALFLISFAALMTEVALTRFFSFSIWYHFAYMTISVALLGYGASGSLYYAFPSLTEGGVNRALTRWSLGAAVLLVVCLLVVAHVPFDPAELFPGGHFSAGNDPRQFLYMSIFYVAVTAPFLAAGLCITVILSNAPARIPALYFADLLGAAAGCVAAVALLTPLGAPGVIVLAAGILVFASFLFALDDSTARPRILAVVALFAIACVPLARHAEPYASGTKFLPRIMSDKTEVAFSRWSPVYRVDVVRGKPGTPMRFGKRAAWGVSDNFYSVPPENMVITHDGDASTMIYKFGGNFDELRILDRSLLLLPYLLLPSPEVLVIGTGGGVDLLMAMKHGAAHVTGIELNPVTVGLLKRDFVDYTGNVFNSPQVDIHVDEGRNFVRRHDKKYDLIQITGIDTLAAVYSGAYVLSESYLYTVEALKEYLTHLKPGGFLHFVRGDLGFGDLPPRQVLRLVTVATEALRELGAQNPADHILVTMSKSKDATLPIFSLLIGPEPIAPERIERIRQHASTERFQPWHVPGEALSSPVSAFLTKNAAEQEAFLAGHWMNLRPVFDDRPFFFNFLKWGSLLQAADKRADYTFASGQFVLLAILAQSIVFAALLILAPLWWRKREASAESAARYLFYFACLGIGFIFIEISYIQRFTLFLGSPVFSLSVIMATLLLASGIGSYLTGRLAMFANTRGALRGLLAVLVLLNVFYIFGLPATFRAFLGTELPIRIGVAMLLLMPAGLVMGTFLPLGMRVVGERAPAVIPWAWAANGVASVVGSILCIVLAISIGFRAVNGIALIVYLIGGAVLLRGGRVSKTANG
ncbi:hypothetical protein L6Q96_17925 [Candidatus Binatia bacterium]|nr:hypothetical protein [Candidatus Binatia bacterium]